MSKKEDVKKALQAGYDEAPTPEQIKEVDPGANLKTPEESKAEVQAAAPAAEAPAQPAEAPKAEPKFRGDLFKPFTLGATLRPGPTGNIMSNMKKPNMDYVAVEKQSTRNVKMTAEDLQKLKTK